MLVFEAFYRHAATESPISLPQLISYVWLQQSFLALIMLWFRDNEVFKLITTGNIAYELCRPSGMYGFWYAKLLAQPHPYRLSLPPDVSTLLLFVLTLILGLFILVSISMLIYMSVFITMSPTGSLLMFGVLGEFLAGMVIPVPFTFVIPFGLVNYIPLLYVLDKTSGGDAWLYMVAPMSGIAFIVPCLLVWRFGVKHYRSTGS